MARIYTGIGSRKTPTPVLRMMTELAQALAKAGWILRSGGADGADSAFEQGCDLAGGTKEIFLPWKGFNGNASRLHDTPARAFEIARATHPAWERCSQGAQKLHARNICQILGQNLDRPSNAVVAWTENGALIGGTATALKLAATHGARIVNLGAPAYAKASIPELLAAITADLDSPTHKKRQHTIAERPLPSAPEPRPDIPEFQGPNRFLSNFWPARVMLDGVTYPTVEHAYQAAKVLPTKERHSPQPSRHTKPNGSATQSRPVPTGTTSKSA